MGGGYKDHFGVVRAVGRPPGGACVAYFPGICKNFACCGTKWSGVGGPRLWPF